MKKNKQFIKFLLSLYQPVKFLSIVMIMSMILSQVAILFKQFVIKGIIDLPSKSVFGLNNLLNVVALLVVFLILELIFFYLSNITRTILVPKRQRPYISEMLFNNLKKKKYNFFLENYSGKISSSINEIIEETTKLNDTITTGFVSMTATMISNLIILFSINYNIFLIALILFGGIIVARLYYFYKNYVPLIVKYQEQEREFSGVLNDAVMNFTSLKIYNTIDNFSRKLKSNKTKAIRYKNAASKKEFSFGAIVNVIFVTVFTLVLVYSVNLFNNNQLTIGDFVFVVTAILALKTDTTKFSWTYIHLGESLSKLKNCFDLLYSNEQFEITADKKLILENSDIEFKNINFKYTKNNVLENFNLRINNHESLGIIGVSGSGKTTLINLLFRFFEPQNGEILIDKKNIQEYSIDSLYENITYVPQETILLHDTIYENIKIAKQTATEEEIISALKKAELYDFIKKLDDGIQTIVGERGIKLSGGQRQRIALARIFLRDAKILIFDEATSSLDNNTEFSIQQNINKYFKDKTIICIAHRLTTLKDMDRVAVIKDGKIIEYDKPSVIIPKYENMKFDV